MANPNKIGLVIGALIGGWHLSWSLLVAIGWAQPFIDFIFWAHMIRSIYIVKSFDPLAALTLRLSAKLATREQRAADIVSSKSERTLDQ